LRSWLRGVDPRASIVVVLQTFYILLVEAGMNGTRGLTACALFVTGVKYENFRRKRRRLRGLLGR